eukprot:TRINITY_DN1903_c0_g1_i1.p1 TRINITY_DN1903_c0_g1~~TRINITY_DN1903_c0_g1_i1.p1  ORF type:complete len:618 (+),score=174.25 TRINITY_DN1903_c0_g1_i1:22-1854(+)
METSEQQQQQQAPVAVPLPAWRRFVCVEFPGFIAKDPPDGPTAHLDKAMATFGGAAGVSRVAPPLPHPHAPAPAGAPPPELSKTLPLVFRPGSVYAHPAFGERVISSNLLLRVRTRGREVVGSEVLGIVHATVRFNGMADFQYLVPEPGEGGPEQEQPSSEETPLSIPPDLFSMRDKPLNYNFEGNPLFREELAVSAEGQVTKRLVKKARARPKAELRAINFRTAQLPEPPARLPHQQQDDGSGELEGERGRSVVSEKLLGVMRQLFEERPVWSFEALHEAVAQHVPVGMKTVQRLARYVSYYFTNGPWRHAMVRYGYDPRKDPSSLRYQVVEVRSRLVRRPKRDVASTHPRGYNFGKSVVTLTVDDVVHGEVAHVEIDHDRFRLRKTPLRANTSYILWDVDNPHLHQVLTALPPQPCWTAATGWIPQHVYDVITKTIKEMYTTLVAAAEGQTDQLQAPNASQLAASQLGVSNSGASEFATVLADIAAGKYATAVGGSGGDGRAQAVAVDPVSDEDLVSAAEYAGEARQAAAGVLQEPEKAGAAGGGNYDDVLPQAGDLEHILQRMAAGRSGGVEEEAVAVADDGEPDEDDGEADEDDEDDEGAYQIYGE